MRGIGLHPTNHQPIQGDSLNAVINPESVDLPARVDLSSPNADKPVAQLLNFAELRHVDENNTEPLVHRSRNPLHAVKATLRVCVGEAVMTVGELMSVKENHVMRLDREVEQAVDILLEGRVIARGQLMAIDDQFAVRITELPLPLAP